MKAYLHNLTSLLLLFIFLTPVGLYAKKEEVEKSKTVEKTIQVNSDHELTIDNSFGEVKITTWDKNEVKVKVTITVTENKEKKAQESLDDITIEIEESKSASSFKTKIVNGSNLGTKAMQIDYVVSMPKSNSLDLENSFGAFIIDDLDGKAKIEVEFGSANLGKINHPESDLTFKFCDPVTIEHLESADLTLKYSKLDLFSGGKLKLESEFSSSDIEGLGSVVMELKFGSVELNKVIDIEVKSNMSKIEIDELSGIGEFDIKYGKLEIDHLKKDFDRLEIDGEFSPIDIEVEAGAEMKVDLYASMANIKVPSKEWTKEDKESNSKSYRGTFGNAGDRFIDIKSSFGKIELDF